MKIIYHRGIDDALKWVNDFIFFRYPRATSLDEFGYDKSLIEHIALELGWPWAKDKHTPFHSSFTYIGFRWCLHNKTVELPKTKHLKYLDKLGEWLRDHKVSLKMTESLIGTLNHICLVLPRRRSHLPLLFAFRAGFPVDSSPFVSYVPSKAVMDDIKWWESTLQHDWCGMHVLHPPAPLDVNLYVDVSTMWGMASCVMVNGLLGNCTMDGRQRVMTLDGLRWLPSTWWFEPY